MLQVASRGQKCTGLQAGVGTCQKESSDLTEQGPPDNLHRCCNTFFVFSQPFGAEAATSFAAFFCAFLTSGSPDKGDKKKGPADKKKISAGVVFHLSAAAFFLSPLFDLPEVRNAQACKLMLEHVKRNQAVQFDKAG